ncbi:MAG: cytochrome P450 [Actinomycetota bacterium]|nr:cytochrome P450 [Actinomycetota bacterium]
MHGDGATLPPGPPLPVAAQTAAWILRPIEAMEACARRYGDMFTYRLARFGPLVFVSDPEDVKAVFTGSPRRLHAGEANAILEPVLGSESILLLDEDRHLRQRKLMLPSFHGERLRAYEEQMEAVALAELERWPRGEPVAARPRMQAITLDVIMRTVFGVEGMPELRTALKDMLEWTTARRRLFMVAALGPGRVGLAKARREVDELVYREIRRRRKEPPGEDILSLLLQARDEDGVAMTDQEIRDELMTLLLAGHETTATALAWALEQLSRNPEAMDAIDGEEMLDAVVAEVLRLRPVIVVVVRLLTEPMELGGRLLPAGVRVAPCIHLMHRRPEIYPDPAAFRPQRFLETPPGTYTWIPFGGGPRRCLGASFAQLEMKVVLRTVLRHARLRPTAAAPERIVRRAITFVPERGGRVVLDPA